jgi:hypothetical protein
MMRDILFTIASRGPQPTPLHLHVGEWETFIDAESNVTVQFARAQGQVVARILEPHDDQVEATLVVGSGVPDLLATLRQATGSVGTGTNS